MQVLLLTLWCRVDCTDLLTLQIQVLKLDKQQPYVSTMYHRHCLSKQIALWNSAKGYNIFQKFSHTSLIHRQGFEQGSPGVYSWWWFYLLKALTERLIEMNHRAETHQISSQIWEQAKAAEQCILCTTQVWTPLLCKNRGAICTPHTESASGKCNGRSVLALRMFAALCTRIWKYMKEYSNHISPFLSSACYSLIPMKDLCICELLITERHAWLF